MPNSRPDHRRPPRPRSARRRRAARGSGGAPGRRGRRRRASSGRRPPARCTRRGRGVGAAAAAAAASTPAATLGLPPLRRCFGLQELPASIAALTPGHAVGVLRKDAPHRRQGAGPARTEPCPSRCRPRRRRNYPASARQLWHGVDEVRARWVPVGLPRVSRTSSQLTVPPYSQVTASVLVVARRRATVPAALPSNWKRPRVAKVAGDRQEPPGTRCPSVTASHTSVDASVEGPARR